MFDPEIDLILPPKPVPRTKLERWMWANHVTGQWLAKQCKVDASLISLVVSGKRKPSEALGKRLSRITGLKTL